eukprot:scaffold48_cov311-Pinguiococcus_pyrenoidosus.AAC.142
MRRPRKGRSAKRPPAVEYDHHGEVLVGVAWCRGVQHALRRHHGDRIGAAQARLGGQLVVADATPLEEEQQIVAVARHHLERIRRRVVEDASCLATTDHTKAVSALSRSIGASTSDPPLHQSGLSSPHICDCAVGRVAVQTALLHLHLRKASSHARTGKSKLAPQQVKKPKGGDKTEMAPFAYEKYTRRSASPANCVAPAPTTASSSHWALIREGARSELQQQH